MKGAMTYSIGGKFWCKSLGGSFITLLKLLLLPNDRTGESFLSFYSSCILSGDLCIFAAIPV